MEEQHKCLPVVGNATGGGADQFNSEDIEIEMPDPLPHLTAAEGSSFRKLKAPYGWNIEPQIMGYYRALSSMHGFKPECIGTGGGFDYLVRTVREKGRWWQYLLACPFDAGSPDEESGDPLNWMAMVNVYPLDEDGELDEEAAQSGPDARFKGTVNACLEWMATL